MPTPEQVEVVRRSYEAFNRRDLDAVEELLHPEFEVNLTSSAGFDRGKYVGVQALEHFAGSYWDTFTSITIEIEEVLGPPEGALVAVIRARGRGSRSGIEVDARGPHLWRFRDGRAVSLSLYEHLDEALAAAETSAPEPASRQAPPGARRGGRQ